jgi:nucleotide-binding universal stress UspA family protein
MMHTDIVVGVDASHGSAAALAWALDDASRRGARVRAVLAWADEDRPAEVDAAAASPGLEDLAAAADAVLRRMVAAARAGGGPAGPAGLDVPVDERPVYGTAAHALLQESLSAGLLVVGARSHALSRPHTGARWALPGPVGETCAHRAAISLVVVPAESDATRSRADLPVVVGVDGSLASAAAARWAAAEAALRGVPLRVLRVADARSSALARAPLPGTVPLVRQRSLFPGIPIDAAVAMRAGLHGRGRSAAVPLPGFLDPVRLVDRIVADLRAMPEVPSVEKVTMATGPVPARLLDAAEDAQLLVLGARGLGGFPTLTLGSTAHQCLAHATCPTAIIRGR